MDVESTQCAERSHLGERVTTRRLLGCCAPKRAALETPVLGDRRRSRIGWPRRVGACARRRSFAVGPAQFGGDDVERSCRQGQRGQRRVIGVARGAEENRDQVVVRVFVRSLALNRSDRLCSALGHLGHARRVMRMRRLFMVPFQMLVDGGMCNSPCG